MRNAELNVEENRYEEDSDDEQDIYVCLLPSDDWGLIPGKIEEDECRDADNGAGQVHVAELLPQ